MREGGDSLSLVPSATLPVFTVIHHLLLLFISWFLAFETEFKRYSYLKQQRCNQKQRKVEGLVFKIGSTFKTLQLPPFPDSAQVSPVLVASNLLRPVLGLHHRKVHD